MASGGDRDMRVVRRIITTVGTGALTYFITNLTKQPQVWTILISVFIAGVILVVQFLIEFESRMRTVERKQGQHAERIERVVERGYSKINEATELFRLVEASAVLDSVIQLVRNSTQIDRQASPLIRKFAQCEITRVSSCLKELGEGGDVTYEGEDRDWLLGLARCTESTIDATSLATVDAGGRSFVDGGLWTSDLGQRYLEVQADAIKDRHVKIRRIFIPDRPGLTEDSELLKICEFQESLGIAVRILPPSAIQGTHRSSLFDFILFDDVISYEATPASRIEENMRPVILKTRLVLKASHVEECRRRFEDLWESAHPLRMDSAIASAGA